DHSGRGAALPLPRRPRPRLRPGQPPAYRRAGRGALRRRHGVRVRVRRANPPGTVGQVPLLYLAGAEPVYPSPGGRPFMTPSVSGVSATYNYGRFRGGALESALTQTHRDLEVVVIDDGSTDDTPAVVAPFLADPRVRYHRTDHLGQPGAKNAGIRLCRAPLIAFLDADDLWLPTKLEKQLALFQSDPQPGVAYAQRLLMDQAGHLLQYRQPACHRGHILAEMYRTNFVCFSSVVVRGAVFAAVGLSDERLPMAIDYDLWLRAAKQFRFDYVAEPLVKYRAGHANLSRRLGERLQMVRQIRQRFLTEHGG